MPDLSRWDATSLVQRTMPHPLRAGSDPLRNSFVGIPPLQMLQEALCSSANHLLGGVDWAVAAADATCSPSLPAATQLMEWVQEVRAG